MSDIQKHSGDMIDPKIIESLVLQGDLSRMDSRQKVQYYNSFCQSLGLNPLTQPFQIIKFQGKEALYAKKDATEQLRKIYGVSIIDLEKTFNNDLYIVTAKATDKTGRSDTSTGAVNMKGLQGEALANAIMKAETKAKRRVTLSICGLGLLDESETDSIGHFEKVNLETKEEPKQEPAQVTQITTELKGEEIPNYTEIVRGFNTNKEMAEWYTKQTKEIQIRLKNLVWDRKRELELIEIMETPQNQKETSEDAQQKANQSAKDLKAVGNATSEKKVAQKPSKAGINVLRELITNIRESVKESELIEIEKMLDNYHGKDKGELVDLYSDRLVKINSKHEPNFLPF